jgi:nucleoid-associated protein YgaU
MGIFGKSDKEKEKEAAQKHEQARAKMEEAKRRHQREEAAKKSAAAARAQAPATPAPASAAGARPVGTTVPASTAPASGATYTVRSGDSLSKIAKKQLGDGNRWQEIYALNRDVIGANPDLIKPGQKLRLPDGGGGGAQRA